MQKSTICENMMPQENLRIAVIGSGIAGLSAAWLLGKRHSVTLYEKENRLGGHSNTVSVDHPRGVIPVDTGFIVYNEDNYPNLTALFQHLRVPTKASNMSFAASLGGGAFEYSGSNLDGLFGQRLIALKPSFWRMIMDLRRFYREAPLHLSEGATDDLALGDYLRRQRYGSDFIEKHILPMGAAIWSTTAAEMMAYPAETFIRFFESHGLLRISGRPEWRTVEGGSIEYVRRLSENLTGHVRYSGVRSIERTGNSVALTPADGETEHYDHVVIAAHADQALGLLKDPDRLESRLLGSWRYTKNRAVLHSDTRLMPRRRRVWSSWNFIQGIDGAAHQPLCVSYWMNLLQSIAEDSPLFVTLNPPGGLEPKNPHATFDYEHPFFDQGALDTQKDLWSLQGRRRTWFCGSYFGYGFHEDALESGLSVAEQLGGINRPWSVQEGSNRVHVTEAVWANAA